jgi:hypothetical protein
MSSPETIGIKAVAAKIPPRDLQRHAGDDKAASQHRRPVAPVDPLANTVGLSSCHYKRRVADDKATAEHVAALALAAKLPPAALSNVHELLPSIDHATSELRRRVFETHGAEPRERRSRSVAWSVTAAVSIPLCLGVCGLIFVL